MGHYDHTRAYLHSTRLRWSYGAMKGREADLWQKDRAARPIEELLPMLACAGFDGVFIDRYGFDDGGSALECSISDLLAAPPLLSANGRCLFLPLTAYRENLQHSCTPGEWQIRRDPALSPVLAQSLAGFPA